ncbi:MAG: hypothetical protein OES13_10700 [Acidimicrobiia bacterium]|nr:hypothetical protein [Acidimicrobiia bacterium]
MANPVTVTETITTGYSAAEAQKRVAAHLGSTVRTDTAGKLMARSGSQLAIRLLGAYLMPKAWMPVRTTVEFVAAGTGCAATVTCADDFGFGLRTGMRGRYEGLLQKKVAEIREVLVGASSADLKNH